MANTSLDQYIKINKFVRSTNAKGGIGLPQQKRVLKRPYSSASTQSGSKMVLFDARQKLLKKKPIDARTKLLAKKRLSETFGTVPDARMKLQAKQKLKAKAASTQALSSGIKITSQNQYAMQPQQFGQQEIVYQQPYQQNLQYNQPHLQQMITIPQQQHLNQQPQQETQQPGIYNYGGILMKTIATNQFSYPPPAMNYVNTQPATVEKRIPVQKTQTAVKKKNIIRLKPVTAPSPSTQDNTQNIKQDRQPAQKSALERIASTATNFSPIQSYKVIVSNLADSVSYEDIEELFSSIGPLRRIRYTKPRTADIFFIDRSHAIASVNKYDNRELDGLPMSVVMATNQPTVVHKISNPEVLNLLSNKARVATIDINPSIVHQALFKPPYTFGGKDVKFTVRM